MGRPYRKPNTSWLTIIRRPLVAALTAFLLGLFLAFRFANPSWIPFLSFLLLLSAAVAASRPNRSLRPDFILLVAFAPVGALCGYFAAVEARSDCRARLSEGELVTFTAVLEATYKPGVGGASSPLLPLRDSRQIAGTCVADFRISIPASSSRIPTGSPVWVRGRWREMRSMLHESYFPRDPDRLGYIAVDSISLVASSRAVSPLMFARAFIDRKIEKLFPFHQALVDGLLLGRRENLGSPLRQRFADAGLAHLLAISGMHVGLFAGVLMGIGSMIRLTATAQALSALSGLWIYLLMIGAPASALRAGIMLSVAIGARVIQRPYAKEGGIAAAALILLAMDPMNLLDVGFQLSFAGVIGLLYLRRPLLDSFPSFVTSIRPGRWLAEALAVGGAAFLATGPIVIHHFGVFAPISVISGVPSIPLLSLSLVGAIVAVALDGLAPGFSQLIADGSGATLDLLDLTAAFFSSIPGGSIPLQSPPGYIWFSIAVGMLLAYAATRRVRRTIRLGLGTSTAAFLVIFLPLLGSSSQGEMEIHFIDVGQGDAIAIRTPADRWMLVDTGPRSDRYDAGEMSILPLLRQRGARSIELLVLTHPDLDHIGGAPAILRYLPVGHVFEPGIAVGREPYLELLEAAAEAGSDWRAARSGRLLVVDGIRVEFLWPDSAAASDLNEPNEGSAILRISFGNFSALLTGDAGVPTEAILIRTYGEHLRSDFLKLGHHGSATSTSPEFLDAVQPQLAVVSAGRRNRYGHPSARVLAEVDRRRIALARTDIEGTISYRIAPGGDSWERMGY